MNRTQLSIAGLVCLGGLGAAGLLLLPGAPAHALNGSGMESFILRGSVRDFRPQPNLHPDFDDPTLNGPYCKYVQAVLDEDGKPVYSSGTGRRVHQEYRDSENRKISWCLYDPARGDTAGAFGAASNGAVTSAASFAQWFRDVPGWNLSTTWDMELTFLTSGPYAGSYAFETNDFFPFYPIDGELYGNGPDEHNFYFTFEIVARFTYDASAGQFLRFKGDDDTWVFIDGQLAMDHGGITGSREYYVEFDRLGLTDGEEYTMSFFHAERKQPQSQFHLWTNVEFVQEDPAGTTISAIFD